MNRLRDLREDKDLYQKDIADILGLDKSTYGYYETEVHDISTDILCKIADYYKVSTDYILYNTDERTPHNFTTKTSKNRLKKIRRNIGLKQIDVAREIHMSQNGLSQYETYVNDVPTEILIKLSELYKTSIDYILCRTNNPHPYKKSIFAIAKEKVKS